VTTAARVGRGSLPTSPERIRERYAALRSEIGPDVGVVVATKYVSLEAMENLAQADVEIVGENRLQDLEAKYARYGSRFRWHFIGHLQSRKAKDVSRLCELVHSLGSLSAAERLTVPALVEVNLSGEETKSGIAPDDVEPFLDETRGLGLEIRGLMTMPPLTDDPERSRPYFRRLRELAEAHGLHELSMGTTQDYRVAVEEGATMVRVGSGLFER
jgi:pyridoxal phosphate enzyme (YggS family)